MPTFTLVVNWEAILTQGQRDRSKNFSILLVFSLPAWATTFEKVLLVSCYDGDTCKFTLPGIHPFFGKKIGVRIRGIDTPEIRGKCPAEKEKAKDARDYLRNLLRGASRIDLVGVKRGKYFRIIATVQADLETA